MKLGRIEALAKSDAFTIITMKMSPEGDLRQRLNHHFIESIDFIFLLQQHGRECISMGCGAFLNNRVISRGNRRKEQEMV